VVIAGDVGQLALARRPARDEIVEAAR